ncbi:MAG: glucosamine-6-phosphate deaminase [Candidatus Zhuqueibacterota bacterium]
MNAKPRFIFDSDVENKAIEKSEHEAIYPPTEKIPVIMVPNFPTLGKLAAIRFLEWVQKNPGGVISLPTGKTPEHFIKWVRYYLKNWDKEAVKKDLESWGIKTETLPDMKSLHFVQIDEFYPINPQQHNSFYHYINKFYIKGFGLDRSKSLLIDCYKVGVPQGMAIEKIFPEQKVNLELRTRQPNSTLERIQKTVIEQVDHYCTEYETQIRNRGGIGFFLGGIGPDGHIGFNVRGSDLYSTTRLTPTNYETQAAAATDMGGIEIARNRLVITIGLNTITFNKNAVAIIIAAGETKAPIVADAIEQEKNNQYPASALRELPHARFYLTRGAAKNLVERRYHELLRQENMSEQDMMRIVTNLSMINSVRLKDLTQEHFKQNKFGALILQKTKMKMAAITQFAEDQIKRKIQDGLDPVSGQVFMHTAPHHDDEMLGFWPYMVHLVRDPQNTHYFNYMTSGFNAVTNKYVLDLLLNLRQHISTPRFEQLLRENYFDPESMEGKNGDVHHYLDGIAAHSRSMRQEAESKRLLRNLIFLFEEDSPVHLKDRIAEMISYFKTQYPGKKDLHYIQQLKGMIREWEADLVWAYLGFSVEFINHLRLGFYKGDIFTEEPDLQRDVQPVLELMERIKPTVITVAFDPEGSGPDTHYKVMQSISEALKLYEKKHSPLNIEIWGYRNVWHRFHPVEATTYVPVSINSFASLDQAFMNCFGSQRSASFPSYEFDGPFSRLAQQIMVSQYQKVINCLGQDYFFHNDHPRLRAAHGFNFLRKMTLNEFYQSSLELKKSTENI